MARLVQANDLSTAWLSALEYVLEQGGKVNHLVVSVASPGIETPHIRNMIDGLLNNKFWNVESVAGTIFPQDLYLEKLGEEARFHLYDVYSLGQRVRRRVRANGRGTYFERLTAWPVKGGEPINQLELTIQKLKERNLSSNYELSLSDPETDLTEVVGLPIYAPETDAKVRMGFPCLSHLSLTKTAGHLDMTAIYRNQYMVQKAYGNYLGLSRLLNFLCREAQLETGELVCVATHADAEVSTFGKRNLQTLVERATLLPVAAGVA